MPEQNDGRVAPEMMEHLRDMVRGRIVTVPAGRVPENGEAIAREAYPELNAPVPEAGEQITAREVERLLEQLRTPEPPTMWAYPTELVERRPGGHGLTPIREREQPGWEQPGEDGVTRNRHGDPIVEIDLAGSDLNQGTLDYAYREVLKAATNMEPGTSVELRIKRFAVSRMPRLIADTGVIYELLVKMIDEREEANGGQ